MNRKASLSKGLVLAGSMIFLWLWSGDPVYAHNCGDFRDCYDTLRGAIAATVGLSMFAVALSLALDFIPGVGQVKGGIEAITGKDLITGEELSAYERILGVFGPVSKIAAGSAAIARGARNLDNISDAGSAARRGSNSSNAADTASSVSRQGPFTVDPAMQAADQAAGVLRNGSYIKNPTARQLNDLVTPSGKIGSKQMSGQYMYVVDEGGNIIIGTRGGQRMPHPTLIGGENPQVKAAGIVDIRGGQIYKVDNASGHFKPSAESLKAAEEAFSKLPSNAFRNNFQGYVPFN